MRGHWSPWQPVYYPRLSQQSPPCCSPILAHQQPCGLMGERPDAKERLRRMSEHPTACISRVATRGNEGEECWGGLCWASQASLQHSSDF